MARHSADAYAARINRVLDYVRMNPDLDLSLGALARVAHLSEFHFHRIFKHYAGETLNAYVRRSRLETVVGRARANPQATLTRIALEAGFNSTSDFSRTFKKQFGLAPRDWDRKAPLAPAPEASIAPHMPDDAALDRIAESGAFRVVVKEIPRRRLAYIRVVNPYGSAASIMDAYHRLMDYRRRRVPADFAALVIGMSQDDPDVTPLVKCRYDVCVTIPDGVDGEEGVSVRELPASTHATTTARGDITVVSQAWQYLFHWWLPRSRWQPANAPAMELFKRTPDEIGWEAFDVECAIPVEPL